MTDEEILALAMPLLCDLKFINKRIAEQDAYITAIRKSTRLRANSKYTPRLLDVIRSAEERRSFFQELKAIVEKSGKWADSYKAATKL